MIFKTYNSDLVARVFFNGYLCGGIFLSFIALYGLISGAGVLSTLSGSMFIVIVSLLSLNKLFRRSSFSVLLCIATFLFFNIPTAFILFEGVDYNFGDGLASIPFEQKDYLQALPYGFLYLAILWIAVWFGIITGRTKIQPIDWTRFSSISPTSIVLLGIIVSIVTWNDNLANSAVYLEGATKVNGFLAFIFFDHAYLAMAGLILFFKLNELKYIIEPTKITSLVFVIFVMFMFIFIAAGSKGATLGILMLFLFIPFSAIRGYANARVSFPTITFLVVLVLMALPLFYFSSIQRMNSSVGIAPDFGTLLAGLSDFDGVVVYDIPRQVLYRLSWGGIDRFLLIFQSFVIGAYDADTAREFVIYLAKNTSNLLLPGTPFPEAYAPSSQLFSQVIEKNIVGGEMDAYELMKSYNTQPYTIFGVFVIIIGAAAPVVLYLFIFGYIFIFNKINNILLKLAMLYFFLGALSSYGIEAVLGNSIHLFVSIMLMYFLMNAFSKFRIRLPRLPLGKTDCVDRPAGF